MRYYISVFVLTFLCSCTLKKTNQSNITKENSVKAELQGQWNLLSCEEVNNIPFIEDESLLQVNVPPLDFSGGDDWEDRFTGVSLFDYIIESDSIFEIDSPIELLNKGIYSVEGNYITLNGTLFPFSCQGDTLEIYYIGGKIEYLKVTYIKSKIDREQLSILNKYAINYLLLSGKWVLRRSFSSGYDETYLLDFPHEIPDTINITKKEIMSTMDSDKGYKMMTDSEIKKYTYGYTKTDKGRHLILKPDTTWYSDYPPTILYERPVK